MALATFVDKILVCSVPFYQYSSYSFPFLHLLVSLNIPQNGIVIIPMAPDYAMSKCDSS